MMIPFDFNEPKLVPLCTEYLKTVASEHPYFSPFVTHCLPLECIICGTNPKFVISDKYNTIQCEFTKQAMLNFKKSFMYSKLHTLKGKYAVLKSYFPHCTIDNSLVTEIKLIVTSFEIVRGTNIAYAATPDVTSILESPELDPMLGIVQSRVVRKAMEMREESPQKMETMLTDPDNAEMMPMIVSDYTEASKAMQKIIEDGMNELLEKGDKLLDYTKIDIEERNAESEIRKLRYKRFSSEEGGAGEDEKNSDFEEMGKKYEKDNLDEDLLKELEKELPEINENKDNAAYKISKEIQKFLENDPNVNNKILEKLSEISVPNKPDICIKENSDLLNVSKKSEDTKTIKPIISEIGQKKKKIDFQ